MEWSANSHSRIHSGNSIARLWSTSLSMRPSAGRRSDSTALHCTSIWKHHQHGNPTNQHHPSRPKTPSRPSIRHASPATPPATLQGCSLDSSVLLGQQQPPPHVRACRHARYRHRQVSPPAPTPQRDPSAQASARSQGTLAASLRVQRAGRYDILQLQGSTGVGMSVRTGVCCQQRVRGATAAPADHSRGRRSC